MTTVPILLIRVVVALTASSSGWITPVETVGLGETHRTGFARKLRDRPSRFGHGVAPGRSGRRCETIVVWVSSSAVCGDFAVGDHRAGSRHGAGDQERVAARA